MVLMAWSRACAAEHLLLLLLQNDLVGSVLGTGEIDQPQRRGDEQIEIGSTSM